MYICGHVNTTVYRRIAYFSFLINCRMFRITLHFPGFNEWLLEGMHSWLQWRCFFFQADTEIADAWGGEGQRRWSKMRDAVDRRMMFANWDNEDDDSWPWQLWWWGWLGLWWCWWWIFPKSHRKQKLKVKQRQRPRVSLRMRCGKLGQSWGCCKISSSNVYRSLWVKPYEIQGFGDL